MLGVQKISNTSINNSQIMPGVRDCCCSEMKKDKIVHISPIDCIFVIKCINNAQVLPWNAYAGTPAGTREETLAGTTSNLT